MLSYLYLSSIEDNDKYTDLKRDLFLFNYINPYNIINPPELKDNYNNTLFN
jgi:hypothetical protein